MGFCGTAAKLRQRRERTGTGKRTSADLEEPVECEEEVLDLHAAIFPRSAL